MLRNPIHVTGALRHCYLWATSGFASAFIKNPNFNPDTEFKTSIYCVHGTADRSASFSLIASRLQESLPENIDGIHLLAFDDRLKGSAVEDFVKQLKNKIVMNGDKNVILMGHSRGGLIVSWFKEFLAEENGITVHHVTPICGPFRGTYLAMWPLTWLSSSVDEMKVDHPMLKELSQRISESHGDYLFVGAEKDQLLQKNSWMPYHLDETAENCLLLDRHGHLSIMSSHRLVDRIISEIWTTMEKMTGNQLQQSDAVVLCKP